MQFRKKVRVFIVHYVCIRVIYYIFKVKVYLIKQSFVIRDEIEAPNRGSPVLNFGLYLPGGGVGEAL